MRAACGGNTLYFGPAAEKAFMAFEQKTNQAMEIAGNRLYLQFQRAHTGPCGCGRRFMLGFAAPALLGTKDGTDRGLPSACTCGRCQEAGRVLRDKAAVESFSPERSSEEPGGLGASGRLICPQKRGVRRKSAPPT